MNEPNTLQVEIDRLVDGELSPDGVTSLLQRCESEDAWRSLAISLLEAREVSDALRDLLEQPVELSHSKPTKSSRTLTWILSAACLACFGFLAGWFAFGPTPATTVTSSNQSELKSDANPDSPTVPEQKNKQSTARLVGYAQIHGPTSSRTRLPVIAGPDIDYEALLKEPFPVSGERMRRLRNQGYTVEWTRKVTAFEFEGQRFAIPHDKFRVRYVGKEVL